MTFCTCCNMIFIFGLLMIVNVNHTKMHTKCDTDTIPSSYDVDCIINKSLNSSAIY